MAGTFSNAPRAQEPLAASRCAFPSIRRSARELAPGLSAPVDARRGRPAYDAAKRALDIVVALLALILLAPLMAAIAILIRLDSAGPVLFRQRRVGLGGRTFMLYKFRSMYVDSRDRFPDLFTTPCLDDRGSVVYKRKDDPRVTRVGRVLRTTSLDELPNLWNVLRGEMSLVGPRPELLEFMRFYAPRELAKFSVRSGLTGLAQTSGRGALSVPEQIAADLEYAARQSMWLDLVILARTVKCVFMRDGAF